MHKIIISIVLLIITISCGPNSGTTEVQIDKASGTGIVDFGSEGIIIYNLGTIVVKRDSVYMLANGSTFHTMSVRVYHLDKKEKNKNCCLNDTTK